jgi:hypothetical protein
MDVEMRRNKISVPLDPKLRELVERAAEREDRTVARYVRHVIVHAIRNAVVRNEQHRRLKMIAAQTESPAYCCVRDCVWGAGNNIYLKGCIVHRRRKLERQHDVVVDLECSGRTARQARRLLRRTPCVQMRMNAA